MNRLVLVRTQCYNHLSLSSPETHARMNDPSHYSCPNSGVNFPIPTVKLGVSLEDAFSAMEGTIKKDSYFYQRGFISKDQYNEKRQQSCKDFLMLSANGMQLTILLEIVHYFSSRLEKLGFVDTQEINCLVLELSKLYHEMQKSPNWIHVGNAHPPA